MEIDMGIQQILVLDTRQTGTSLDTFAREAKIIQVDKNELGSKIKIDIEINSDVKDFIVTLNKYEINIDITEWLKSTKISFHQLQVLIIMQFQDEDICVDVGQHNH